MKRCHMCNLGHRSGATLEDVYACPSCRLDAPGLRARVAELEAALAESDAYRQSEVWQKLEALAMDTYALSNRMKPEPTASVSEPTMHEKWPPVPRPEGTPKSETQFSQAPPIASVPCPSDAWPFKSERKVTCARHGTHPLPDEPCWGCEREATEARTNEAVTGPDDWTRAERWLVEYGLKDMAGTVAHYALERIIRAARESRSETARPEHVGPDWKPGMCMSCETRPASAWCSGCVVEDYQAAHPPDALEACALILEAQDPPDARLYAGLQHGARVLRDLATRTGGGAR